MQTSGGTRPLHDQIAIVTGASRGIGRAVALELASVGATVVVNYRRNRLEAEAVAADIEVMGSRAASFAADVGDEAAVRALVQFTLERYERIDLLVCNAGVVRDNLVAAMQLEEWDEVLRTNLRGAFLCIREVTRPMMSQRGGCIINVSSVAADVASRGHSNYAAAKAGLNALTRSLAVELAPKKIRVNAVAPGVILTDMTKRIRSMAAQEILERIPLRRFGEPEEVARAVRFLASPDASYITGEVLHVTGGLEI